MASIEDSKNTNEEDQKRDCMLYFPQEISADIASRLDIKSLIKFRLVSKTWKSLSRNSLFIDSYHSRAISRDSPCIILLHNSDQSSRSQLYLTEFLAGCTNDHDQDQDQEEEEEMFVVKYKNLDHQNPNLSTNIPLFFSIIGSCNGLLCLLSPSDELWLHNPFTRDYKQLPKLLFKSSSEPRSKLVHQGMFGFGFHRCNTKDEFKIIKICYQNLMKSEVFVLTIGSKSWRKIGEVPNHYQLENDKTGVSINGRIHWVCEWSYKTNHRKILSFDLSDELFKEIPSPNFHNGWYNCQLFLVQECLATAVFVPSNNESCCIDIWIMEKYGIQESWNKKYRIRGNNYLSKIIGADYRVSMKLRKDFVSGNLVKIVCVFKNGEILLEFKGETFVSYNPQSGLCRNLRSQGMPNLFQTIVHVGSLNWID